MPTMSNLSTPKSLTSPAAMRPAALSATRYECQHCHTHTFLVLRVIGSAKCCVCESYDLVPVDDQPAEQDDRGLS
jgi:hypothetical protein